VARLLTFLMLAACVVLAAPERTVEAKHMKIVLKQSPQNGVAQNKVMLIAEITLEPGMHVYAPGIQKPYLPIRLFLESVKGVTPGKAIFPKAKTLLLEAIDERVPAYEGKFRIEQPVTVSASATPIEIKGSLYYQTCDDKICYRPVSIPVTWTVEPKK
jgi:DsbC/DsbD-like thiol-disulfide interchange protein